MAAKKWLAGCLLVLVLLAAGAVAAWYFVLKPMWRAGVDGAKDWVASVDLGDEITNHADFSPPADGRLSPAQAEAFVRVQEQVVAELGPELQRLAEKSRQASPGGLADVGAAFGDVAGLATRWRAAQARGVNASGLSREEYAWVRRQSLAAMSQLVDLQALSATMQIPGLPTISPPDPDDAAAIEAARHNAELLRPHLALLRQAMGTPPPGG